MVKWLWEETHIPKVVGSTLCTVYWMNIFSQIFVVVIVMLFEKTKTNEKDAGDGPFIKKLTAGKNKARPRQFPLSRSSSTGTRTPPS